MPDPKDFMNDDHEYVRGYVRRKQAYPTVGHKRNLWFWRLAWYWRLLMILGGLVLVVVFLFKYPLAILGAFLAVGFWYWFFHPGKLSRKDAKIARRTWRRLL